MSAHLYLRDPHGAHRIEVLPREGRWGLWRVDESRWLDVVGYLAPEEGARPHLKPASPGHGYWSSEADALAELGIALGIAPAPGAGETIAHVSYRRFGSEGWFWRPAELRPYQDEEQHGPFDSKAEATRDAEKHGRSVGPREDEVQS